MSCPETRTSIWPKDSRKADDKIERISIAESGLLKKYKILNSPVNNEIIRNKILSDLIDETKQNVIVRRKTKKSAGKVYTICALYYDDEALKKEKITGTWNLLTGYDRRIYNTLCSMWLNDIKTVTLNKIFTTMNGYVRSNPAQSHLKKIRNAIGKLKSIIVYIDMTEENKKGMLDKDVLIEAGILKRSDDVKAEIKDNIIHVEFESVPRADGKKCIIIRIIEEPILLTYNRAKRTLIDVPIQYISFKNSNATEKMIAIQDYLLMRIISYKKKKLEKNKILYDTLYRDSGIRKPELSKDRIRDRKKIYKLMEDWIEKGLITSYKDVKSGRAYSGIVFEAEREK